MIMGINAPFAQLAGAKNKKPGITLFSAAADPEISSISCEGEIIVTSIKDGVKTVETYNDLDSETLSIAADARTKITITGNIVGDFELASAQVYKFTARNTALTSLNCNDCYALQSLNLSANTALTSLNCNNCSALAEIHYPANNETVSTAIAGAITNAKEDDGVVYTTDGADYYDIIVNAASGKGWSIMPIAA